MCCDVTEGLKRSVKRRRVSVGSPASAAARIGRTTYASWFSLARPHKERIHVCSWVLQVGLSVHIWPIRAGTYGRWFSSAVLGRRCNISMTCGGPFKAVGDTRL